MSEIPLNKFEKHDLVIRLHNEGKTYREIAHIAHISPRDIKPILKKYEQNLENKKRRKEINQETTKAKKLSLSSQAFTLFKDGKKPTEVAIILDIPSRKVSKFWWQFLKLEKKFDCYEFYEIWQNDLPTLLSINNFMKRNNVYGKDIVNVLRTASDVNTLNQTDYKLKTEIRSLEHKRMYYSHSSYGLQPIPLNKPNYNYYHYLI